MKFFLVSLLVFSGLAAQAQNIYVAQTARGTDSGADAGDAHSLAWLNATGNWGTGTNQVAPGTTVHLCGTVSSPFTVAGSGAIGSPITILFEPGAKCEAGTLPGGEAFIDFNNQAYVTVDGAGSGLIDCTNNGTGLNYSNNVSGIIVSGNNIMVKNLTITNIYNSKPGDDTRVGYPIKMSGSSLMVTNCVLSDGDAVVVYTGPANGVASNIYIVKNQILNFNHGIFLGTGNAPAPANSLITNLVISGNYLDHTEKWNETSESHHLDYIILNSSTYDPTALIDGFYICNNTFGPNFGPQNTAGIYDGMTNPQQQKRDVYIYNNVFMSGANTWGNGFVSLMGTSVYVVNNTCIGNGNMSIGGTNAYCYNNVLCSGVNLTESVMPSLASGVTGDNTPQNDILALGYLNAVWSDYNVYTSANLAFGMQLYSLTGGTLWGINGGFGGLSTWQTYNNNEYGLLGVLSCNCGWKMPIWNTLHCDPHSVANTPTFMPSSYIPASNDHVANGKGTNLFALGITQDFNGNPRPSTGAWTIGAFQAAVTAAPLPPPGGLHVIK